MRELKGNYLITTVFIQVPQVINNWELVLLDSFNI